MIYRYDSTRPDRSVVDRPFRYDCHNAFLDFAGWLLPRNGTQDIITQDVLYPNEFPYLYPPRHEQNLEHSIISFATREERDHILTSHEIVKEFPLVEEFYYRTSDFIEMPGSSWSAFRKKVSLAERRYHPVVLLRYPKEKLEAFITLWHSKQNEQTVSYEQSLEFFWFCFEHQEPYRIQTLYVEIDGKLAGIAMGAAFDKTRWVGLHLKVDYTYKGLSRWLHHERAKLFEGFEEFTLGSSCAGDEGIEQYKKELNPIRTVPYYYVITGKKKF